MPSRRELLAFSFAVAFYGRWGLDTCDAKLGDALKAYWLDTQSEISAWHVRNESRILVAAIERAGIPNGWKIHYQLAVATAHCRAGSRGDKDFWCDVRGV